MIENFIKLIINRCRESPPELNCAVKLFVILLALNLCAVTCLFGHLNDTKTELVERFGPPALEQTNQAFGSLECVFQKGGWEIHAFLLEGRCHMLFYTQKGEGNADPKPTARFKTAYWKMLEGLPLGVGTREADTLASLR